MVKMGNLVNLVNLVNLLNLVNLVKMVMLYVFARMIESSVLHSTMQKSSVLGCTLLTHFQH